MYVVSNAVELQEVVTLPYTKTIYVNGTIQGNQFPNGESHGNASPFSVDYQWGRDSQPEPGYDRRTVDCFVEPWREL